MVWALPLIPGPVEGATWSSMLKVQEEEAGKEQEREGKARGAKERASKSSLLAIISNLSLESLPPGSPLGWEPVVYLRFCSFFKIKSHCQAQPYR